jgi:hypothetical protein
VTTVGQLADHACGIANSNTLSAGPVGPPQVVEERIRAYERAEIGCMMLRFTLMLEG